MADTKSPQRRAEVVAAYLGAVLLMQATCLGLMVGLMARDSGLFGQAGDSLAFYFLWPLAVLFANPLLGAVHIVLILVAGPAAAWWLSGKGVRLLPAAFLAAVAAHLGVALAALVGHLAHWYTVP
jgi:hypothetical protein